MITIKSIFYLSAGLILNFGIRAAADEVWAPGVSANGGYVDFNKSDGTEPGNDDGNMCWAATAGNVIQWWQNQNANSLTSTAIPDKNPWDVFRIISTNCGSNPRYAYDWWINGTNNSFTIDKEQATEHPAWANGRFLYHVYNTEAAPIYITGSDSSDIYSQAAALVSALAKGYALSLEVGTNDGRAEHAITLWGLKYHTTVSGTVLDSAYITDSDDGFDGLVTTGIDFKETGIYLTNMKITNLSYNIKRADGMRSELVPEPTTAMLSLLSLCGVLMRRRRP